MSFRLEKKVWPFNFNSFVWHIIIAKYWSIVCLVFVYFLAFSLFLWFFGCGLWSSGHWGFPLQWHNLHKQSLGTLSVSDGMAGLYLLKLLVKPPLANHTHLSGNALHHHPGYRSNSAPLRVIKWALGMIQAGQGTDLVVGICGLVGRLKEGHRRRGKHRTNPSIFTVKRS